MQIGCLQNKQTNKRICPLSIYVRIHYKQSTVLPVRTYWSRLRRSLGLAVGLECKKLKNILGRFQVMVEHVQPSARLSPVWRGQTHDALFLTLSCTRRRVAWAGMLHARRPCPPRVARGWRPCFVYQTIRDKHCCYRLPIRREFSTSQ